ncbi:MULTISPECIES: pyruvate, water dikinase regulatory protein [unclassified Pseudoclavibacter]|uniref:pyruvate, water dikinase regulatory protein n=1 Tax=unclassified Pseudoclavibacter TaxID=2615177 RepID=UPI0013014CFD|nr:MULTISPECIES: pyruvate, water dikinase regulatory protein [unclassified Pseudoclavibacter]KAB1658098.1 kinase/pyrophosphorylase [Pseudoclavibacter sp. CFCC 11306]KAB1661955.1 kinase/pyrophosphorylase [Pseudoclavibacter sp. CFCC 13796]
MITERETHSVFFVSDGTGITAETLGNTLLTQFPNDSFIRATIPFVNTVEYARTVVRHIDSLSKTQPTPLVFSTVVSDEIREVFTASGALVIDLLGEATKRLEQTLHTEASHSPGRAHGQGDLERYNARMHAVEFAIEHDDGQSLRALDRSDIILIAPSRCGKTPTTMYLALQHGVLVANYPLIHEDFGSTELPAPIAPLADKCFGLLSTPQRLSEVRSQRRPDSRYASLDQCRYELRNAEEMYRRHNIPFVNSASKSIEEMSSVILHSMSLRK